MEELRYKALSGSEKELVLAARPKKLRKLDEDELIELHKRVRKARDKYVTLHRRRASEQVGKDRARGKAAKRHRRVAEKAEIFEDALARVSRQLAVAARRSSAALKEERLAAAQDRGERPRAPRPSSRSGGARPGGKRRRRHRRPDERRRVASERAAKRRHEAKRR
jgi:hypothetical protein